MEKLTLKATFKGENKLFEKYKEYSFTLKQHGDGWMIITLDDNKFFYKELKEFVLEWTNISNI